AKSLIEKSQEYANAMGLAVFGDDPKTPKSTTAAENLYNRIITGRKDMLDKIAELDAEYARKSMSSDEEELQALKDKFTKFRRIIEEENDKIRKYNAKHPKKAMSLLDVSAVDPIEERAESNLLYTQSTVKLQKQYEADYKLFQAYEELKKETSEQY